MICEARATSAVTLPSARTISRPRSRQTPTRSSFFMAVSLPISLPRYRSARPPAKAHNPGCTQDVHYAEYRLWGWGVASVVVLRAVLLGCLAGAALLLAACAGAILTSPAPSAKSANGAPKSTSTASPARRYRTRFSVTRKVSYGAILIPPPARLQLVCFKEQPAIVVGFDFKIGSTRNAEVAYRFDEKPGHEPRVRIVDDHKTVLIDDPKEVAQFVDELATSENLYLRIRALTAPRTSAEFTVAGAGPMIAAAYASCPLNTAIARRNASARASQKDDDD